MLFSWFIPPHEPQSSAWSSWNNRQLVACCSFMSLYICIFMCINQQIDVFKFKITNIILLEHHSNLNLNIKSSLNFIHNNKELNENIFIEYHKNGIYLCIWYVYLRNKYIRFTYITAHSKKFMFITNWKTPLLLCVHREATNECVTHIAVSNRRNCWLCGWCK